MSALLKVREPSAKYLVTPEAPLIQHFELLAASPGGVARLRELVLTLAVQGKLVPQDPRDEPASVLLERIRTEKERLVAVGVIKRQMPSAPTMHDKDPSALPRGWQWSSLAAVGIINPRNEAADDVIASFVQMSSIPVALTAPHDVEARPWRDIKSGFTQFAEGDVGVAKITPCFENGKSTVFTGLSNGIGAGTTELHIVRPLCGTNPKYVLLFAKTPAFLKHGELVMTGSAGQKRMPRAYFESTPFPLPPLAEQSRIVTRVEELMRLCDALEAKGRLEAAQHSQLVTTLFGTLTDSESPKALADRWQRIADHFDILLDRPEAVDALEQTILQLAVRGLLVPQDPQDEPASVLLQRIRLERTRQATSKKMQEQSSPPLIADEFTDLPSGWQWATINTLAEVGTGATPSRDNASYFHKGTISWVTSGETGQPFIEFTGQHVTELALSQTSLTVYPVGTLKVAMYGQGKTRGQVAELQIEAATNQACAAIALVEPALPHRRFIKLFFEKIYDEIRELSAGGAQPNLNLGKVKATVVPLPPLAEQARIVARVEELRRLCTDLRQRLAAAQATQAQLAEALVAQPAP